MHSLHSQYTLTILKSYTDRLYMVICITLYVKRKLDPTLDLRLLVNVNVNTGIMENSMVNWLLGLSE